MIFWYRCVVLPPVDTTGLTVDDVPEFANKIREDMLAQLRDMAGVSSTTKEGHNTTTSPPSSSSAPSTHDAPGLTAAPDVPSPSTPSSLSTLGTTSSNSGGSLSQQIAAGAELKNTLADSRSEGSVASVSSSSMSENGTETEEDEGMVLVGHPAEGQ